jgi:hypothetical protein
MGNRIAGAIRRKMKTLHPFPFLLVEYLNVSRQIAGTGFENPGPQVGFVGSNGPAHS